MSAREQFGQWYVQTRRVEVELGVQGSAVRRACRALKRRGLVEWAGYIEWAEPRPWIDGLNHGRAVYRLTGEGLEEATGLLQQRAEAEQSFEVITRFRRGS